MCETSMATVFNDDGTVTRKIWLPLTLLLRFARAMASNDATVIDTCVSLELKVIVRLTIDVLDNSSDVSDDDTAPSILLIASKYCATGKLLLYSASPDRPFNTNDGCDVGWLEGCPVG